MVAAREDFSFETVFSHPSKLELIQRARTLGYFVVVCFIVLDTPEKYWERVCIRVDMDGHAVPINKVYERFPRVIEQLCATVPHAQILLVVDNSADATSNPYHAVALYQNGYLLDGASYCS